MVYLTPRLLALRLLFIVMAPSLTRCVFACSAPFTSRKDGLAWTHSITFKSIIY